MNTAASGIGNAGVLLRTLAGNSFRGGCFGNGIRECGEITAGPLDGN